MKILKVRGEEGQTILEKYHKKSNNILLDGFPNIFIEHTSMLHRDLGLCSPEHLYRPHIKHTGELRRVNSGQDSALLPVMKQNKKKVIK